MCWVPRGVLISTSTVSPCPSWDGLLISNWALPATIESAEPLSDRICRFSIESESGIDRRRGASLARVRPILSFTYEVSFGWSPTIKVPASVDRISGFHEVASRRSREQPGFIYTYIRALLFLNKAEGNKAEGSLLFLMNVG